jgi:uncharacterized protein (TIGR02246 family)
MKKAFGFFLAASLAAAVFPAPARAAESGDKAAIERLTSEFVAAWNAHDPKKMAAVCAEDGNLINPFGQTAQGRAEIEKFFEKEQSTIMKGTTYKLESTSIRGLDPSCAIADWEAVVTGMMDPSGKPLPEFRHHAFSVCVKKGGQWRVAAVRAWVFQPIPGGAAK